MRTVIKVYTKGGDRGQTALRGGTRVSKSSPLIDAYGTIDELNATVAYLHDCLLETNHRDRITIGEKLYRLQNELFELATEVAGLEQKDNQHQTTRQDVERLETEIDTLTKELPELRNFVLASGYRLTSLCHICRTVCRRAERKVCTLENYQVRPETISYLNRLSDWLFTVGRYLLHREGRQEVLWSS